jgi:hypothetical protein
MKRFILAISAIALLGSSAHAATLCTTACSTVMVDCGFKLKVTTQNSGGTLTLTPPGPGVDASTVDPIFNHACPKDGITITNPFPAASGQGFSLDCNVTNQNLFSAITGSQAGKGITLRGPGLALFDCIVDSFAKGIVATADGADIEDSQVMNSVSDGFFIRDSASFASLNFVGDILSGNLAITNGGYGFNIVANGLSASPGSTFNNIANSNGKGGFLINGNGNTISGANAAGNNGAGITVFSPSCCTNSGSSPGQDLDTAQVDNNTGPGILYAARDDGTNCPAIGPCLPSGFNPSFGGIFASNDGTKTACPPGAFDPTGKGHEICLVVLGKPCSQTALNACK